MGTYFWLFAVVAFGILEAVTVQLVSIWFIAGSLAAFVAGLLKVNTAWQVIIFFAVSFLTLVISRPLVKKVTNAKKIPTNADSLIGKETVVTSDICNIEERGSVKIAGIEWSARSADGTDISQGEKVKIEKIEGVKLIVSR